MAGRAHRRGKILEPTRSGNVVYPTALLDRVSKRAEELKITPAEVARLALESHLSGDDESSSPPLRGDEYLRGVTETLEALREEVRSPNFPSGKTLGDRIAERIMEKLIN